MLLRSMAIAPRAALGFGAVALLVFLLGAFSLLQMSEMRQQAEEIDKKRLPSVVTLAELSQDILRLRAITLRLLTLQDAQQREANFQRADELHGMLAQVQGRYESIISSPAEREGYERFKRAEEHYLSDQARVVAFVRAGDLQQALVVASGQMNQHADEMAAELRKLSLYNQENAALATQRADQVFISARTWVIAMMLLALVMTVLLAFILTRSIVTPLSEAVRLAEVVASGDLTQTINQQGRDEPAQLLAALAVMQMSLRDTVQNISDSSGQLASASEELHAVTDDATRVLVHQNGEIEQAVTGVTQLTLAAEEVARNAVSVSDASSEANRCAQQGREQVRQTVVSIQQLTDEVTAGSVEVSGLADRVREIGKVLDVIGAIAEQTNLLALNAAIEAARAGDAGRGFAVVADEVRALAHRTQKSTQEIDQMVKNIQQGSERAVSSIQSSATRARTTLELAHAAGDALDFIAQSIASINERNQVIASASEEQARVESEVAKGLDNIRELSVQTAAGAQQTNVASQELSRLAVALNQEVGRFRI